MSKLIAYFFIATITLIVGLAVVNSRQKSLDQYLDPKNEIICEEDIELEKKIKLLTEHPWAEIECEVTMYTLDECGKASSHPKYGITAHGYSVLEGRTAAASPEIPVASLIKIPGLKNIFQTEDRGGAIKTHKGKWPGLVKIDIYTKNKKFAKQWGRKKVTCSILYAPYSLIAQAL